MIKHQCPNCKNFWYTADTITEIFKCSKCGTKYKNKEHKNYKNKKLSLEDLRVEEK